MAVYDFEIGNVCDHKVNEILKPFTQGIGTDVVLAGIPDFIFDLVLKINGETMGNVDKVIVPGSIKHMKLLNLKLNVPKLTALEKVNIDGVPIGTYFYVVTAFSDDAGNEETTISNEMSVVLDKEMRVKISWAQVTKAKGYKIYRSNTTGDYTNKLLVKLVGEYSSYLDSNTVVKPGTPPIVNGANIVLDEDLYPADDWEMDYTTKALGCPKCLNGQPLIWKSEV